MSIIIATLDCPKDLKECLTSASHIFADLNKKNFEILIQDGSTDDNVEKIACPFKKYLPILYRRQSDTGIYDAWNKALKRTSGKWVFFLGADDRFIPGFPVDRLLHELKTRPEPLVTIPVKYVFGDFSSNSYLDRKNFSYRTRYSNPFHHQGAFQQTKLIKKIGFDTRFKIGGDFDTLLAMTQSNPKNIVCLDMPALVEMHSGGVSSKMSTNFVRLRERAMVRKKNGIQTNYPIVLMAYLAATIKVILARIIGDDRVANYLFQFKSILQKLMARPKNK